MATRRGKTSITSAYAVTCRAAAGATAELQRELLKDALRMDVRGADEPHLASGRILGMSR